MGFASFVIIVAFFSLDWFLLLMTIQISKKGIDGIKKNAVKKIVYLIIRPFSFWVVFNVFILCTIGNTFVSTVIMDMCNTSNVKLMITSGLAVIFAAIGAGLLSIVVINE